MIIPTLNILHLRPNTGIQKVDEVAQLRYDYLMQELSEQKIRNYKIWDGEYNPDNPKLAISKGHHRIVQYAKVNNLPYIIIAEDDIKFTNANSWQYFLSQIPKSFDTFSALLYSGTTEGNKIISGGSGMVSLYMIHSRFYDTYLSMVEDAHVDRNIGDIAKQYECLLIDKYVVEQRGGYSFQKCQILFYHEYLRDKKLYGQ